MLSEAGVHRQLERPNVREAFGNLNPPEFPEASPRHAWFRGLACWTDAEGEQGGSAQHCQPCVDPSLRAGLPCLGQQRPTLLTPGSPMRGCGPNRKRSVHKELSPSSSVADDSFIKTQGSTTDTSFVRVQALTLPQTGGSNFRSTCQFSGPASRLDLGGTDGDKLDNTSERRLGLGILPFLRGGSSKRSQQAVRHRATSVERGTGNDSANDGTVAACSISPPRQSSAWDSNANQDSFRTPESTRQRRSLGANTPATDGAFGGTSVRSRASTDARSAAIVSDSPEVIEVTTPRCTWSADLTFAGACLQSLRRQTTSDEPLLPTEDECTGSRSISEAVVGEGISGSSDHPTSAASKHWCTDDVWAEWRKDFPLDVLDVLADFYGELPLCHAGRGPVALAELEGLATTALSLPSGSVSREAETKGLFGVSPVCQIPVASQEIIFPAFQSFLELLRATVERERTEHSPFFLKAGDLEKVESSFHRHSSRSGWLPRARLWDLLLDLNHHGLQVCNCEQQSWLGKIVDRVLGVAARPALAEEILGRSSAVGGSSVTTLRQQQQQVHQDMQLVDVVRILSAVLFESERKIRQEEFQRECSARRRAGFSLLEVEDLRELHRAYGKMALESASMPALLKNPALRLKLLFDQCGIQCLEADLRRLLETIVSAPTATATTSNNSLGDNSVDVAFDVFILWMKKIFDEGLGGLKRPGRDGRRLSSAAQKQGFAAMMLQEQLQTLSQGSSSVFTATTTTSTSGTQRSSSVHGNGGSGTQGSSLIGTRGNSGTEPLVECAGTATARATPACWLTMRGGTERLGCSSLVGSCAGSRHSSLTPFGPSRDGSKQTSRQSSRSTSGCAFARSRSSGQVQQRDTNKVLLTKGLPPTEAMLGGKRFRANSANSAAQDLSLSGLRDAVVEGAAGSSHVEKALISARQRPLPRLPWSATGHATVGSQQQQQQQRRERREKEGQDSSAVVVAAAAKLNGVRSRRSSSVRSSLEEPNPW